MNDVDDAAPAGPPVRGTLASWVGDVDAFSHQHWQIKPAAFSPADFCSPFDLDRLDAAFQSNLLRTPYLEMVRSNKVVIPPEAYTASRVINGVTHGGFADRSKVLSLLRGGATLLLRCVDQWHAETGELVAGLSRELGRRVEAFFFVTPSRGQGLAVHRDDADVFVLQVAGAKTWYVHDAPDTGDWAPGDLRDDERSRRRLRTVLQPGDVLYVPRGFAHRAVGAGGLSAHLSLTIRDVSLEQLKAVLEERMSEGLGLPERPLGESAIADACAALLSHYRARLESVTPEELRLAARAARAQRQTIAAAATETFADVARDWPDAERTGEPGGSFLLGHRWRRPGRATGPAS
jgi:hypothetical protein